ncbi:MAG: PLP-dependent aminotransferase family protein [Lachnospiraceae bacterium]|nr:PLP-dependent aminotransferase family protein [Ruminococcus sp.]MCM1276064.1 PLP-dependent aminotransferase family protein [Lachnospiraceae bacterium]
MLKPFSNKVSGLAPSAIREILKFTADPEVISFAAGNPAPEAFPVETIARLSAEILREEPVNALQYSVTEGYAPLRGWLESDLRAKGMFAENDMVIVTAGAQQAIETTAKILCNEGDVILCEDPSFIGSLNAFRSYGVRLVGVAADKDGVIPERLEAALKAEPNAKFLYTIPNFQNPTGNTTTLERRKAVLELAEKYGVYILEDNPYGDLRFAGEPVPCYKALDKTNHVLYAGTFSKTLAPGLRVGFLCGEREFVQKAVVGLQTSTVHTNIWAQMLTHRFVTTVDFNSHLTRLQGIYRAKYKRMADALRACMPDCVTYSEPEGGLFIWATVPEKYNMNAFCTTAVLKKVAVVPGNAFLADESGVSHSFRLNFSTPTDEQIDRGVEILGKCAEEFFAK